MTDRFRFRVPVIKNNEFDGFVFINLGEKLPELHGGHYGMAEQCTGLKDNNGNLIYEGDIVKDIEGYLGVVEFCDITAKFIIKFDDYSDFERDNCFELNIVGNIHENTDLLG